MTSSGDEGFLRCTRCRRVAPLEEVVEWGLLDQDDRPICPNCFTDADKIVINKFEVQEAEEWEAFRDAEARRTEWLTDDE